jgi:PAS domain S-box-containing protein
VIVALTEGIVVHDAEAAILTCNAAAEEILGLTRDQMSGRSSLDLVGARFTTMSSDRVAAR